MGRLIVYVISFGQQDEILVVDKYHWLGWRGLLPVLRGYQDSSLYCLGDGFGNSCVSCSSRLGNLALMELDGKLAAVKILSWRQHRVPLTHVGGNPLAAKFFSSKKRSYMLSGVDKVPCGVDTSSLSQKKNSEEMASGVDKVPCGVDTS
ncbi:hypothetical protein Taro_056603 [Colocasia esculenta]|uniref:Uncharacterized protein n=1 Tax=Colocasia esculenta TaxID=4460 RepID=A0A843XTY3_COLES|nr:hypothetical protein [Colocasia esculenta]